MNYDYIIVGLGPSGITTALELAKTKAKLLLVDADNDIGGCWKTKYFDNLYHSEHSPKVLFSQGNEEFKKLLQQINVKTEYANVYESNIMVLFSILYYILNTFNIRDYYNTLIYLFLFLIGSKHVNNNTTVERWCRVHHISQGARKLLNMTSIAINGTSISNIKMFNLFKFLLHVDTMLYYSSAVQMIEPNKWLYKCKQILQAYPNVTIVSNTKIDAMYSTETQVKLIYTNNNETFVGKNIVLCVPLRKLYDIVSKSSLQVQRNWFATIDDMKKFVDDSTYSGFGIQFHVSTKKKDPHLWCWSCTTEWNIIVVNKSLTLKNSSYDTSIQTVWGCVVCDFKAVNTHGKSINDYDNIQSVTQEVLRQLSNQYGEKLKPKKITTHENMYWFNGKWNIHESSFTNVHGALPSKGVLNNLFAVGPHNMDEIVVVDTAIKSANLFCKSQIKSHFK
jgi:hypothetical protein